MTINFKLTKLIAFLPLFLSGNSRIRQIQRLRRYLKIVCSAVILSLFFNLPHSQASFMESIAIDPEAIAVANSVTASPPGVNSIHYNPAGLSLMGDGNYISMGAMPVLITKTSRFTNDPDYRPFHDFEGNVINDPLAGREGTASGQMYIPLLDETLGALMAPIFGITHRKPGSKWTFAYGTYVPLGGGWICDDDDPSVFGGKSVYLQHLIYAAPAVSYRVNNNLSFGVAFGLGQSAMGINMDVRSPNEIVNITKILGDATQGMENPIFDLTVPMPLFGGGIGPYDRVGTLSLALRDDFAPNYNLGALWEPFDWLAFGASYNSPIKVNLTGNFSFQYSQQWQNMVAWSGSTALMQIVSMIFDLPYEPTPEQSGSVSAEMEWPEMFNFGIKVKPIKRLSLMADLHWAKWSSIQKDDIVFDQKIQLLQMAKFMGYGEGPYNMVLKRDMEDTMNWSVGVEYQALDWLSLRAGYENRTTSVQDQYYDLLYALPTLDYYGAGLGIKWNRIDIDLALGYLVNKSYTVANNGSVNMNSTQLGSGVNNPYRGLNYEQEMSIIIGALKATMPLDVVTGMIYSGLDRILPAKWKTAPKSVKPVETKQPVDASSKIVDNLRYDRKYFYTEDSE